jgi:hypothetical protein
MLRWRIKSRRLIMAGGVGVILLAHSYEHRMPKEPPPQIHLSIIYEPVEAGWTQARIAGFPEVITAAPTRAEAKDLVLDALREYLLSLADDEVSDGEREPVALTITS